MSQDFLKLYWMNPTAGETDGTEISQDTEEAPVESGWPRQWLKPWIQQASRPILCAARCRKPLFTESALIVPEGESADCWRLAPFVTARDPVWLAWGQGLQLWTIGAKNRLFWLQARAKVADMDDGRRTDSRVNLRVRAKLYEVR